MKGLAEIRIQIEAETPADLTDLAQRLRGAFSVISSRSSVPDLRITVGAGAFRQAMSEDDQSPLVAVALTSTDFDAAFIGRERPAHITAVYSNPDPVDQITLAKELFGRAAIGIIDSTAVHSRLTQITDRRIRKIPFSPASGTESLLRAVDAVDVVIVLPDPAVLNQSNINHVVRTLYQRRKVLIGYSATLSRVGSLASVFISPQAITQRTVEIVEQFASGGVMPAPVFVRDIDVAFNEQLARSLSMPLPTPEKAVTEIRGKRPKAVP